MDKIYILRDPLDNAIRYVGYSKRPLVKRLREHKCESVKKRSHKNNWVRSLYNRGLTPIIEEIEVVPHGISWEEREIYWIEYYRQMGCNLTNGTDGGESGSGRLGCKLTEEHKAKIKEYANKPESLERNRKSQKCKSIITPFGEFEGVKLAAKLTGLSKVQILRRLLYKIEGWSYKEEQDRKICTANCTTFAIAKGLCGMHYARQRKHGTPNPDHNFISKMKRRVMI